MALIQSWLTWWQPFQEFLNMIFLSFYIHENLPNSTKLKTKCNFSQQRKCFCYHWKKGGFKCTKLINICEMSLVTCTIQLKYISFYCCKMHFGIFQWSIKVLFKLDREHFPKIVRWRLWQDISDFDDFLRFSWHEVPQKSDFFEETWVWYFQRWSLLKVKWPNWYCRAHFSAHFVWIFCPNFFFLEAKWR